VPIYEYNCENCGDDFECIVFRTGEAVECPKCGNKSPKKKMSTFGFSTGGKLKLPSSSGSGCSGCSSSSCSSCS
jgi:putative FmdB family regulatory protein